MRFINYNEKFGIEKIPRIYYPNMKKDNKREHGIDEIPCIYYPYLKKELARINEKYNVILKDDGCKQEYPDTDTQDNGLVLDNNFSKYSSFEEMEEDHAKKLRNFLRRNYDSAQVDDLDFESLEELVEYHVDELIKEIQESINLYKNLTKNCCKEVKNK